MPKPIPPDSAPHRFAPAGGERSRNARVVKRDEISTHVNSLFDAAECLDLNEFRKLGAHYAQPREEATFDVRSYANYAYRGRKHFLHRMNLMNKSPAETILNR
jgi:hypothetical protein